MDDRRPRRGWLARRLAAGIAAAALLAGGGVVLGTHLTSGTSKASSAARVSMRLASDRIVAATTLKHDHLRRAVLRRLLRLGAERGQITFRTAKGTKITFRTAKGTRTVAFLRGVVQRASSGSFAVKDTNGGTSTWNLRTKTAIVRARKRVGVSALAAGQRVFVVGLVVGGADEARLIVIRG
ncbi:MAG TPA: hypothetical protein VFQ44_07335 [Streptosporangiaceae bacterium]|nr:hypothetical protein [Streptosporangiaceae bacterium]